MKVKDYNYNLHKQVYRKIIKIIEGMSGDLFTRPRRLEIKIYNGVPLRPIKPMKFPSRSSIDKILGQLDRFPRATLYFLYFQEVKISENVWTFDIIVGLEKNHWKYCDLIVRYMPNLLGWELRKLLSRDFPTHKSEFQQKLVTPLLNIEGIEGIIADFPDKSWDEPRMKISNKNCVKCSINRENLGCVYLDNETLVYKCEICGESYGNLNSQK
jgi:hypothetical protein